MKKITTALLMGLAFISGAYGQPTGTQEKKWRHAATTHLDVMVNMISTHLNYGELNDDMKEFKKPARGVQAGVSFQAGISPSFSIVSELYYVRKGGKLKDHNPLTGREATLRLHTVELPVLARLHMGHFYVNAGLSLATQISGTMTSNDKADRISFHPSTNGFRRMDASLHLGGGMEFSLKRKLISLDLRYVYGLTDITRTGDTRNRALMISVHYSRIWKTNPLVRK